MLTNDYLHIKSFQENRQRQIHTLSKPLIVGYSWGVKIMAWGCLIFTIFVTVELYKEVGISSELLVPSAFFVISGLSIYHFSKYIKMDTNTIEISGWFGRKDIKWAEIERLEYQNTALVFYSKGKNYM